MSNKNNKLAKELLDTAEKLLAAPRKPRVKIPKFVEAPSWLVQKLEKIVQYKGGTSATLRSAAHIMNDINKYLVKDGVKLQGKMVFISNASHQGDSPYDESGECSWDFAVEIRSPRKSTIVPIKGVKLWMKWEDAWDLGKGRFQTSMVSDSRPSNLDSEIERVKAHRVKTSGQ